MQAAMRGGSVSRFGLLEVALSFWHELTHGGFQLTALKTQRGGESLVTKIVTEVMVAVLLRGVWLGLMTAIVLLGLILYSVIYCKSRYLQFSTTLRSLQLMPPGLRNAEKS